MYCVKCGVKLQDGIEQCPLCQTPVWNPGAVKPEQPFSQRIPAPPKSIRYPVLGFVTVLLLAVCLSLLIFCLKTYGAVSWSGYVMLGGAVVYGGLILPFWFERPQPLVFLPLFFALVCGYLLYICLYTGGKWFLSFAFPVVMLVGALVMLGFVLFRYGKRRRLRHGGILLLAIGGVSMLIELFECITFGTQMFTWSLYSVSFFALFGLFFLLASVVPPLRDWLERRFFV